MTRLRLLYHISIPPLTKRSHSLFNGRQRAQRLVPPGAQRTYRLDILLLRVLPLLRRLIKRRLHADIRLHLPLRRLLPQVPRDIERVVDVNLMRESENRN